MPARHASNVDLPAPDGPKTAVMPVVNCPATSRSKIALAQLEIKFEEIVGAFSHVNRPMPLSDHDS